MGCVVLVLTIQFCDSEAGSLNMPANGTAGFLMEAHKNVHLVPRSGLGPAEEGSGPSLQHLAVLFEMYLHSNEEELGVRQEGHLWVLN